MTSPRPTPRLTSRLKPRATARPSRPRPRAIPKASPRLDRYGPHRLPRAGHPAQAPLHARDPGDLPGADERSGPEREHAGPDGPVHEQSAARDPEHLLGRRPGGRIGHRPGGQPLHQRQHHHAADARRDPGARGAVAGGRVRPQPPQPVHAHADRAARPGAGLRHQRAPLRQRRDSRPTRSSASRR